jgi:CheY-like chemotaxis protein
MSPTKIAISDDLESRTIQSGYEAAQEIRRREGPGRHVAIIAMTADAMGGCRERCLEAAMDDFVGKPVAIEALFEALRRWGPVKQPALA